MDVRRRLHVGIARQLGQPSGLVGRLVGLGLNRGNRHEVTAAVDASVPGPGAVAADVGFGSGVGAQAPLDRVDAAGSVHGAGLPAQVLGAVRSNPLKNRARLGRAGIETAAEYAWDGRIDELEGFSESFALGAPASSLRTE